MPRRRRHETCEERAERQRLAHNEAQRRYRARKTGRAPVERKEEKKETYQELTDRLIKLIKQKYRNTPLKGRALFDAMIHDNLISRRKDKKYIAYRAMD